ncbi:hypothetical protein [Anaerobiospirillum succiniciproducens]|uniref:hypothetical protein n=1 Tax=Anaerobiospirillum succiniciproducens TaxID=13335 RepID=UPI003F8A540A
MPLKLVTIKLFNGMGIGSGAKRKAGYVAAILGVVRKRAARGLPFFLFHLIATRYWSIFET